MTKTLAAAAAAGWLATAMLLALAWRQRTECRTEVQQYEQMCAQWHEELEHCRALLADVA